MRRASRESPEVFEVGRVFPTCRSWSGLGESLPGLILAASVGFMTGGCEEGMTAPVVGEPVPDIVLPDLDGNTFRLSEHRGKVVVVNFWASWCPPCVDEMASLERLHRALKDKGLEVVAISVDDSVEDIRRFRQEHGLSFLVVHDEGAKVSHAFQTFKYPETYIVDREGTLVTKIIGPRDWIAPVVMHDVLQLLRSAGSG